MHVLLREQAQSQCAREVHGSRGRNRARKEAWRKHLVLRVLEGALLKKQAPYAGITSCMERGPGCFWTWLLPSLVALEPACLGALEHRPHDKLCREPLLSLCDPALVVCNSACRMPGCPFCV